MKVKNIVFDIESEIRIGVLSFPAIAKKYHVTLMFVNQVWEQMCEQEYSE